MKIGNLLPQRSPAPPTEAPPQPQRRAFLRRLGLGALLAGVGAQAYTLLRALVPNVLYEPPMRFKLGSPQQFPEGVTFLDEHRVFIVREKDTLHAISATCTHLGCTVKNITLDQKRQVIIRGKPVEVQAEFHCPCHGSKYYGEGTNYAGPAPKPLPWLAMEISPDDGQLVVDASRTVGHEFRLNV
ncbi:MAG TPA: Rieske 2Fe-2S domain-containing protein [Terriglobales bacterium]|nr:Rieske 2Fe-2S domain-containing protein [Terriglobales bacterium]